MKHTVLQSAAVGAVRDVNMCRCAFSLECECERKEVKSRQYITLYTGTGYPLPGMRVTTDQPSGSLSNVLPYGGPAVVDGSGRLYCVSRLPPVSFSEVLSVPAPPVSFYRYRCLFTGTGIHTGDTS